ncbi:MAG: thioester domain-containing protein [Acidimicrobiales bacterium]|nr:thioester domain-containing protein [Acidimicrobiales bacterium]
MINALRQGRRRRAAGVVASLAIAAGLVTGLAGPAAADGSQAKFLGGVSDQIGSVKGSVDGDVRTLDAGLFRLVIDGDVESTGYCIDINTPIDHGATLDEVPWDEAVENLDKVEAILRHYHPNGDGPDGHKITGTDQQMAMATQAAIWHYTDGFDLDETEGVNDATVVANYLAILAAVEGGLEGFGEPTVDLSITSPDPASGTVGDLVGPYVVNTSAASVTLTPSAGVSLHDAEGAPFTGEVVDGTELWLSSDAAGEGSISAAAQADFGVGRVFYARGQQRLVLASSETTSATAEAAVTFAAAPTVTTTPPETTPQSTTTAPSTPETSVTTEAPTTTTTAPPVPASNTGGGGGLPVTGAQTMVLVTVALALLGAGVGFRVLSRRKATGG